MNRNQIADTAAAIVALTNSRPTSPRLEVISTITSDRLKPLPTDKGDALAQLSSLRARMGSRACRMPSCRAGLPLIR